MARNEQEGIDLLRFFIGVMALLTVFVAGFAIVKYAEIQSLRADVARAEVDYANVRRVGRSRRLLEAIAREASMQVQVDPDKQDLAQFLQQVASSIDLQLDDFRPEGSGGSRNKRYLKKSIRFSIRQQPLEVIVDYLRYVQSSWPGLKVEELTLKPKQSRDGTFLGWDATALVTAYKPRKRPASRRP
ncbi:MAG: hypothetical protein D6776_09675 [Planctomycetota bacterium]|nr:MAG: hypothetical protein D6776_09675 [Planctomycetota bacterium]